MVGTTISHYEILEKIGQGGMGVVYKAKDTRLERFVALKFLPEELASDASLRERFLREARAASALNHPNICTVYDVGEEDGRVFIAMEFLDGATLNELLEFGPLRFRNLLDIGMQAATGLEAAHRVGVIHRDIKLGNIVVTKDGHVKILDFGLAKKTPANYLIPTAEGLRSPSSEDLQLTSGLAALGTMAYMSPEQALGKPLDARTDLFSFGIVLYEMATGIAPFRGDTTGVLFLSIVQENPQSVIELNSDVPSGLQEVINKCLQKDRELRYQSASEIRADLRKLRHELSEDDSDVALDNGLELATLIPTRKYDSKGSGSSARREQEPIQLTSSTELPKPLFRVWTWVAASALVVVALAAGITFYRRTYKAPVLTEKDTVVLADFANSTDDSVFDSTLTTAVRAALNQSPFLNVLSESRVNRTLQLMSAAPGTSLTPETARQVCQRTNSKAYIGGSISTLGREYVVGLRAVDCANGDTLIEEQATAQAKEMVLEVLGKEVTQLRQNLGESLATVEKFDVRLEDATTSSLDALKAYSLGRRASETQGPAAALPYDQRAIEIDPKFAMGYLAVGTDYESIGESESGRGYYAKAFELDEHASDAEKLNITANYYQHVTGESSKLLSTLQEWVAIYPRSRRAHASLANAYAEQGQYEKSCAEDRQVLQLSLPSGGIATNLPGRLMSLNRFDEARQLILQAAALNIDSYYLHTDLYGLAFLRNDRPAMDEQINWFLGKPEENIGLALAADTEAFTGHAANSRKLADEATDAAVRANMKEKAAIWQENAALREAAFGNLDTAKTLAVQGLKLFPSSPSVQVEAALAFALAGESAHASLLAHDVNARFPLHTQIQALWLPSIRAQLALNHGHPEKALAELQASVPIEFGQIAFVENVSCLYPTYVRGQAYLSAGQGMAAAAEFQKVIDHRGMVWNCWTGAMAKLGLARAYFIQTHASVPGLSDPTQTKAAAAYKDFFALWKDADPDIPVFKQAKAEYAKLTAN